jgi:MoaA/NifB/PqqE/SkfB family radical SAM enzyme
MHLNIGPRSTVTPCCHFDEKVDDTQEDIRFINVNDINTTKKWYNLQKELIMGKKPAGCHKCYSDEDNGIKSQRQYAIKRWGDTITAPGIRSLELKLGAKCNLACRTCSSDSSNKWLKEESLMWFGHINKDWIKEKQSRSYWASDEEFWKSLHAISGDLERITFTGGEPMIIDEHFRYLNWLASKNIKPQIDYITNGTIPLARVQKVFDKFDNISMSLSIDAVGKLSDYMRTGSNWETLYQNIKDYNDYFKSRNFHLDISSTVSVLNVHKIGSMAKLSTELDIVWSLNFLRYPEWMSILSLGEAGRQKVIDNLSRYQGHISQEKMKELYKILKFFNSDETVDLDNIPIWRHILQRDHRHNRANPNSSIAFSKVEEEWWDMLVANEKY